MTLVEPTRNQVLEYCAREPVERVFLEDAARRGYGRFVAVTTEVGAMTALCHSGANLVPSGEGCEAFAALAVSSQARMIIGEARAVEAVWRAAEARLPPPREDRPGQPVYATASRRRRASPVCARRRKATSRSSCRSARLRTSWSSASIR